AEHRQSLQVRTNGHAGLRCKHSYHAGKVFAVRTERANTACRIATRPFIGRVHRELEPRQKNRRTSALTAASEWLLMTRRRVGGFDDRGSADRLGVVACNHTAESSRDEQIDLQRQELLVGDAVGLGVSLEQAVVAEGELEYAGNIETAGAKIGSGLIADGD